ncbi:transporter substrate-binding domain-containing protein [Bradyrhizobium daqingense]|uniref:Amino acid ABC transporter substrate-binding protein (PAAT family) n=1 Tax=Bradyrhizobium daqingense TaxID=993502 RepID=A0A562KNJ6_9BRAD|nr:transporter substrate-binding domain-containing protein [Bradyrhizobium daqingense]TWH96944.1 amino acid ABC transporter substrate-binding protein (PAAT family) [Bradyrhizobium daqingense]UFS90676.1 transporter substrate-binding domain-containing protein [Bradyrhizobium daqingense]
MLTRRDVASIVGLGALGAAAAGTLAAPAVAQTADPNESTFARIRRTKKMRIGAVGGGAPYYMKDLSSGQWKGFYIDIAKGLADDMEAELEITETTWGNSVLDLQANKIDIFFGLNPTPKRALVVDFSVPVFNNAFAILCKKDFKPKSWAELNSPDIKIAVDQGSSHDQVVSRLTPKAQITRLKTADEATAALQTGRVDAQCLITMLSLTVLKKNPSLGQLVLPTPIFATTSNAGFRREADKTWRDYVNTWIDFNKGLGFIRNAIITNMELVGVTEADIPPGVSL